MDKNDGRSVRSSLQRASATLRTAGADTPWLDAVVLLCHSLGISKERLFARLDDPVEIPALRLFERMIARRRRGEPVSYIRGIKEFYGREFAVDRRAMVPRPDTEILVDTALEIIDADPTIEAVLDCCTGSGCVAVTLALERPHLRLAASDVSEQALALCRENATRLAPGRVALYRSDLLASVPGSFDLIVANPPYLTDAEVQRMQVAGWPEPALALAGGADGLDVVRRLVAGSMEHLPLNRYIVIEGAFDQRASVFAVFQRYGVSDCSVRSDLAGRDRVYLGRRISTEDDSDAGGV